MSVFKQKIQNRLSVPWEVQQKTFKFAKSPKGKINFRAPLEEFAPMGNR